MMGETQRGKKGGPANGGGLPLLERYGTSEAESRR